MQDGLPVNLSSYGVKELLRLESDILDELRHRGLVRTKNKPLADIAERIVCVARGGELERNSNKAFDVRGPNGCRIQVKAMGQRAWGESAKFGTFRTFDFDICVFLQFAPGTYELSMAREVGVHDIRTLANYNSHTAASYLTLRQVRTAGVDVLAEMRAAYARLDEETSETY